MYKFIEKNLNMILRNNFRATSKNPEKKLIMNRAIGNVSTLVSCEYGDIHITIHDKKSRNTLIINISEHSDYMYIFFSLGNNVKNDYLPLTKHLENVSTLLTDEGYFQYSLIDDIVLTREELQKTYDLVMLTRDKAYKRYNIIEQDLLEVK